MAKILVEYTLKNGKKGKITYNIGSVFVKEIIKEIPAMLKKDKIDFDKYKTPRVIL